MPTDPLEIFSFVFISSSSLCCVNVELASSFMCPLCLFQLMVGQKDGVIRFFSLSSQKPLMSLSCGMSPLLDCDWSKHNCLLVGAAAGSDWIVFDTSMSR